MQLVLARLVTFPVPLVAGIFYLITEGATEIPGQEQQLTAMQQTQGPEWLVGAVAGIWLVVWLLDKLGKLPGNGGVDRRRGPKFEEEDRAAIRGTLEGVQKLREHLHAEAAKHSQFHQLFTGRSDDGIERWLIHHQVTRETKTIVQELVKLTQEMHDLRRDEQRRTGVLVSTLEANQRALVNIQRHLRELTGTDDRD